MGYEEHPCSTIVRDELKRDQRQWLENLCEHKHGSTQAMWQRWPWTWDNSKVSRTRLYSGHIILGGAVLGAILGMNPPPVRGLPPFRAQIDPRANVGRLRGGSAAHLGTWPRIPQWSGRLGGRLLPYHRLRVHLRPLRLWTILLLHGLLHLGLSLGTHAKGGISGEGRVVHTWLGLARLGSATDAACVRPVVALARLATNSILGLGPGLLLWRAAGVRALPAFAGIALGFVGCVGSGCGRG